MLDDLAEDQLAEVSLWPGSAAAPTMPANGTRRSPRPSDLEHRASAIDELMDMPLLAGHLEAGLAAFDYQLRRDRPARLS